MRRTDDAAFWLRLRLAFDEVVAQDEARRSAMLDEIGAADPALHAELERMLAADASADGQLARIDRLFDTGSRVPDALGLIGRTVGHFQVITPLATGGMGAVYRALDTNLERAVALKFPLPHQRPDARLAERFRREMRAAAALDHANICSVYEAGQTEDGQLFLAMALYDGETLKARLAREGSLPIRDVIDIGAQIARGLGAAHGAGIVHRDLKPANVMLLPDGGVKILDFGLARMTDAVLTTSPGTAGTVAYMAPELVGGDAGDPRSDLWALGVLLYEMLAGERPFHHQHDIALMHAILHHDPVRPSLLRSGIEPRLEQLILSLLARDPRARPDTADRVHTALSRMDRQQPADATPATPPRRRTRRTAAAVATFAVLLLALGTWFGQRERAGYAGPRIVAVLPFQAEEADLDAAIIGAALADAVANRLARLASVAAPDGRFVQSYSLAGTDAENTRHIPAADAVVTGTIERSNDDLEVRIEISDARLRRSSSYGFFVAQRDLHTALPLLLREITSALRLELTREERTLLASLPTDSAEAWELYLRGRAIELLHAPPNSALSLERMRQAQAYYVRARELDSDFALARARLAVVHTQLAQTYDTTFDRREQMRLEAEAALRLDPGLPEAHIALRYYYLRLGDHARADAQLQRAMEAAPNRSDLRLAHISRLRDLGHWNEAADELENAIRLDPRNTLVLRNAAVTYSRLRRYEDGIAAWDRLIALDPGDVLAKAIRGNQYLRLGNIDSLAATAARLTSAQDENGVVTYTRYNAPRVQRRYADVLAVLDSAPVDAVGDDMFYRPIVLLRALTLDAMGDAAGARAAYEAASALLESSVRARPRDARLRVALGLAYAGLGRKEDAMAETRTAMELSPITSSTIGATAVRGDAVEVFIKAGEHDEAIRLIERLLAMPAGREVSVPLLRIDPIFDPLRGDRRFEELLVRFNRS